MPVTRAELFERFAELGIETRTVEHPPFMTVDEARAGRETHEMPGGHCKTLFLKDKKKNRYLVVAAEDTRLDLKRLAADLGGGRLSFCDADALWAALGVRPGAVTPFALINGTSAGIEVILERAMLDRAPLNYHPLENTATTAIQPADLVRFIEACGHRPRIMDL